MFALIFALICFSNPSTTTISPLEATAAAKWFCSCVDIRTPLNLVNITLEENPRTTYQTPVYEVTLNRTGKKDEIFVEVDASSGDVVYAYDTLRNQGAAPTVSPQTDVWLKRLGRSEEFLGQPFGNRYDAAIAKHRLFNLNGYSFLMFQIKDGQFAWFYGPGALPPEPTDKPTIASSDAIKTGIELRKKTTPNWPNQLETQSELGVFYDEKAQASKWVWKIVEGNTRNGIFVDTFTNYIDAQSGAPVSSQDIGWSRFMYHSRAARAGLAPVKESKPDIRLVKLAEKKLKALGRSDVQFDNIRIENGIHMSGGREATLELGPNGDIKSFNAPATEGKFDNAAALKKGLQLILEQNIKLPTGRFLVLNPEWASNTTVVFRQRGLNYDYFESQIVTVEFGGKGEVARFTVKPPAPKVTVVPTKLHSEKEIKALALDMAKRYLQKDTETTHYFAQAHVGELGWYVDPVTHKVTLAYEVLVEFMRDVKNWATQGSGSTYYFNAETGTCLSKFPSWSSGPELPPATFR